MITGKTIILIGASGGIGRVLARQFTMAGANVTLSARNKEKLELVGATLPPSQILVSPADASKAEDVERVFEESNKKFGKVDAVIVASGSWHQLGLDEPLSGAVDLASKHFSALFLPTFIAGYVAQKFFRKQGEGLIINISSHAALRPKLQGNLSYGPMKAAGHHFMLALGHELRLTKVRVVDIAPAIVNTAEAMGLLDTEEKRAQAVQPEAIANWIIENFDNSEIPSTKLFDSTLIL